MIRDILQTFFPWIIYFALSGHDPAQMKIAICVAALSALIFERKSLKKNIILSWVTLSFFAFMFVSVVIFQNDWVMRYAWVLSNSALACVAWGSIVMKRPFTLQYARERVTSDKWHHPLFWKINYLLTMTWGVIFLLGIVVNLARIHYPMANSWVYEVVTDAATVFGIWFSFWFPSWYAYRQRSLQINK